MGLAVAELHQYHCSDGSTPPWLRQPCIWNTPASANPMYWPCSIGCDRHGHFAAERFLPHRLR